MIIRNVSGDRSLDLISEEFCLDITVDDLLDSTLETGFLLVLLFVFRSLENFFLNEVRVRLGMELLFGNIYF